MSISEKQMKWGVLDVCFTAIATTLLVIGGMEYVRSLNLGFEPGKPNILILVGLMCFQWVTALLPMYILVIRRRGAAWKDFGFRKKMPIGKIFKYALLAYLAYMAFSLSFEYILRVFEIELPGYEQQEPQLQIFGTSTFNLVVAFILVAIIAPAVEEIYFRGFMLQTFLAKYGHLWGSLLTAVIFSGIHLQFQSIIPFMIISLVINEIYIRTKSTWVTMVFHMINNSVAFGIEIMIMNGNIAV